MENKMVPTGLFLPDGTQVGTIFLRPEREYEVYVVVNGERVRAVPRVLDPNKPRRPMH